ncbi:MAG TPA: recombinase RecA [bacterium]|nr:recombinase RecA [bacterium]
MNERQRALDLALTQIEKQFGKGSIMKLGEHQAKLSVDVIPTGILALDAALGVGGVPRGRIVEIYGPESSGKTTLGYHVVAEAQREGGVAAFIDAEHALNTEYARNVGVDIDNLLISQPDSGEQALEIGEMLVRSGAIDVIVVDSVAALVPRAELDGEMGDAHVGLQARLMSQAMRKLVGAISKSRTTMIFINQLREKVGVMFGCFHYNARVVLADGRTEKIGKIVNQRLPVEVRSYDPKTGTIQPRRVINWFNNGPTDQFLQFVVEGGSAGRRTFGVTSNHMIFTPKGEVPAGRLREGDEVLVALEDYRVTGDQLQLLIGSALGDGSLRKVGAHSAHFRVGHSEAQVEYARWKQWMLEPFSQGFHRVGNGFGFDTLAFPTLADLRTALYGEDGARLAAATVLDRLDARGVAVWYGDDGSFAGHFDRWGDGKAVLYNKSLIGDARSRVVTLFERLGVGKPRDDGRGFWFNSEQTARFHELIVPYVHPSIDYKLHPTLRGRFNWQPDLSDAHLNGTRLASRRYIRPVSAKISKIYTKPHTRSMHRFDLEVEGSHTYLVDGVVVHNSPEITSGGRALKFYASVRMEIRRIETLKSGDQAIGQRVRIKVVKNKLAAPFRDCEADIIFPRGISKSGSLLDVAALHGVVSRSGTWFAYKDMKIGQGRDNAREFLESNPELAREIEARTREKLGISRSPASAAVAPDAAPHGNGAIPEAKSPTPRLAVPTSVPSEDELRKVAGAAVVAKGVAPRTQR